MVIKVKYNGEWVKIPYLSDVHGEELVTEAPKKEQVDSDFVAYEQIQEELNSGQITAIT